LISSHTAAADPASPHLVALSSVHVALVHLHVSALEEARSLLLGCRPHVSSLASTTLLRLEGVRGSLPAASEGGRRICSTWSCGQLCTRTEVHNTVHLTIALSWKICIYTHTHTHRLHTHTHRLHTHTHTHTQAVHTHTHTQRLHTHTHRLHTHTHTGYTHTHTGCTHTHTHRLHTHTHTHTQAAHIHRLHTHTQAAHTHTQATHTHATHTHTGCTHTHTQRLHTGCTHTQAAHTHTHRLHTHTHRLHTHTGYTHTCFPGGTVVKNLPANARDTRDLGSIPGSGRSPGGGNGYPPSLLAWKIPLTEEPGGLQSMGLRRVGHD